MSTPEIKSDFVCIVNKRQTVLAAVLASYLQEEGFYLPMFTYSNVDVAKKELDDEHPDEYDIVRRRAEEFNVFAINSIRRLGGCKNLILAGLSTHQKNYLTFLDEYNIIEIEALADIEPYLGGLVPNTNQKLFCKPEEAPEGLYLSAKTNTRLVIDDTADSLEIKNEAKNGIIIIEKVASSSTVIAINYALSIGADIRLVTPLEKGEEKEIKYLIEEWRNGSSSHFNDISEKAFKRVDGIDFTKYEFATFFTEEVPYSLVLKNIIPFTYVNLLFRPDQFVFNNIFFERKQHLNAAIVFSPLIFKENEETQFVVNTLKSRDLYVQELIDENATVYNIDMNIKQFPFDLLHLCSHGGEVDGYSLVEQFQDRDGNTHTVEYDEVVSFAPHAGEELIPVVIKQIWRKFDGLVWKSPELRILNHPHHVFVDMMSALKNKQKKTRVRKDIVPDSCAIKCKDFHYQAMFDVVAGYHTSPVIFNNTCWSWSGIAESFLAGGARGYIGTIWEVDNSVATKAAEVFYNNAFNDTILTSLQKAILETKNTPSEDIYIYWGLHFSSLKKGVSIQKSRENVLSHLLDSFYQWKDMASKVSIESTKKDIERLSKWNFEQIWKHFRADYLKLRFGFMNKQS